MSAMGDLYDGVVEKLHGVADALVAEEHRLGARLKALLAELEGDVPELEAEAKADVADVVHTAETQGVVPAEREAVADAARLGAHAVADVEQAVADTPAAAA